MTSVFYDVIRLEAVRGGLNVPLLTVVGEFEPKNVVGHRVDPKKHILRHSACFEPLCVKIQHGSLQQVSPRKK